VVLNDLDRGLLALQQGHVDRAAALLREQMGSLVEWGNTGYVGFCLMGLAVVAGHHQQPERVARLLGAAARLLVGNGEALGPVDQHLWDRAVAAQAHLSEERWRAAWTNGQQLSVEQAVAYALAPV
jgi:hypothetical protein